MLMNLSDAYLATSSASDIAELINYESRGNSFKLVEDPDHWAEMGIFRGDELVIYLMLQEYYDYYKELYGVRPRWIWDANIRRKWTRGELQAMLVGLDMQAADLRDAEEEDARRESEAQDATPLTHNPFAGLTL